MDVPATAPTRGARQLGQLLLARLGPLSDEVVARLFDGAPRLPGAAGREEVRRACAAGLEQGLQQLSGRLPPHVDRFGATRQAARRHARDRLPVESALRAQRICGEVLWQAIVETARGQDGLGLDVVLAAASGVWADVDEHASVFAAEFRDEQQRLDLGSDHGQAVLHGLLAGRGSDAAFAREAAVALRTGVTGPLLLAVVLDADPAVGRSARAALAAVGLPSVWAPASDHHVGLVPVPPGLPDATGRLAAALAPGCGPVGHSPVVEGLVHVPQAHRWAVLAARSLPAGSSGVADLRHRLPEALVAGSPDLGELIVREVLAGLPELPPGDGQVLLQTLQALVVHDWSPTRAAAALYCHRNTVLYRQQRIEALTGRDLSDPRVRLLCALAVISLEQQGRPDQLASRTA